MDLVGVSVIVLLVILILLEVKNMLNTTALTAIVAKLQADYNTLAAAPDAGQAAVDSATSALTALDNQIVAATPAPVTPPASS